MKRPSIGLIAVVAAVGLLAAACASSSSMQSKSPEQIVSERQ